MVRKRTYFPQKTPSGPASFQKKDKKKPDILQRRFQGLVKSLFSKRAEIDEIQKEVNSLSSQEFLKPSLFARLKALLGQIASLRHKEEEILSEIGDVERRHATMRKAKRLKLATPKPQRGDLREDEKMRLSYARQGFWTKAMLMFLWVQFLKKQNKKPEVK